jgi:hypothetical protein
VELILIQFQNLNSPIDNFNHVLQEPILVELRVFLAQRVAMFAPAPAIVLCALQTTSNQELLVLHVVLGVCLVHPSLDALAADQDLFLT